MNHSGFLQETMPFHRFGAQSPGKRRYTERLNTGEPNMTKSQEDQDQGVTGEMAENTTPDRPTPDGTSEFQANDVTGAHGQAPAVSTGSGKTYEDNNSAASLDVDRIVEATEEQ